MKNKLGVALLALAIVVAWRIPAREEAPISAGTYLVYDNAGTRMRLTFSPADGDRFDTNVSYLKDDGDAPIGPSKVYPKHRRRFAHANRQRCGLRIRLSGTAVGATERSTRGR